MKFRIYRTSGRGGERSPHPRAVRAGQDADGNWRWYIEVVTLLDLTGLVAEARDMKPCALEPGGDLRPYRSFNKFVIHMDGGYYFDDAEGVPALELYDDYRE